MGRLAGCAQKYDSRVLAHSVRLELMPPPYKVQGRAGAGAHLGCDVADAQLGGDDAGGDPVVAPSACGRPTPRAPAPPPRPPPPASPGLPQPPPPPACPGGAPLLIAFPLLLHWVLVFSVERETNLCLLCPVSVVPFDAFPVLKFEWESNKNTHEILQIRLQ